MRVSPLSILRTPRRVVAKSQLGTWIARALFGAAVTTSVSIVGGGCLDRPVAPATPLVTARAVLPVKNTKIDKIDLLFMIDNSSSMADKQTILGQAVPELVKRLIEPKCVNDKGETQGDPVNGECLKGILDFEPVRDIHIGIVSSSLGNHGANGVCNDSADPVDGVFPHNNDRGHLISRDKLNNPGPTYSNQGFLLYNPGVAGGLKTVADVVAPFTSMVTGVGQYGCGYEASLEAVYRFLIDPEPYDRIEVDEVTKGLPGEAILKDVDQTLLKQRADFLRPDSLVSIMMVTDENDCSVIDGGQGFYPLLGPQPGSDVNWLPPGASVCETNPNDRCCVSCGSDTPAGCLPHENDPRCKTVYKIADDPRNLRCFDQKRKYGASFLYPVQRYIDGFTKTKIRNRAGKEVDNPLFANLTCKSNANCQSIREKSAIVVAGIVGVPWQDIAVNPKNLGEGFKSAEKLREDDVWADIVGDPDAPSGPVLPRDKHMIESITPRSGLPGPGSAADADPINGHEWDTSKKVGDPNADLQYACTFPLAATACTSSSNCDCFGTAAELNGAKNPLCQDGSTYTNTQRRAKAYPGTRILQMLHGLDDGQAIVASICPANVDATKVGEKDYGYTPAIQSLLARFRVLLRGECLPRPLPVDSDTGQVPCVVVESYDSGGKCNCKELPGRKVADESVLTDAIKKAGDCYCEIEQLAGSQQTICKTNASPGNDAGNGWCYVDPQHTQDGVPDPRQCDLVSKCPSTDRRVVRFVNPTSQPRSGALTFIMCQEKSFDSTEATDTTDDVCAKK